MEIIFMKDTITTILAIFGAIGSLYTFISTFIVNRPHVDIEIEESVPAKDSLILYISLCNKSRLPISITDITIWNNGIQYSCCHVPEIVSFFNRKLNNKEIYNEAIKTLPFPITLSSLAGTSGYLYFVFPLQNFETSPKSLTFEVSTNRFHKLEKTFEL